MMDDDASRSLRQRSAWRGQYDCLCGAATFASTATEKESVVMISVWLHRMKAVLMERQQTSIPQQGLEHEAKISM